MKKNNRYIREEEYDMIDDEQTIKAIERLNQIEKQISVLTKQMEELKTQKDEVFPFVEKAIQELNLTKGTVIRAGNLMMKIKKVAYQATNYSYSKLYDFVYERVDEETKRLADELKETVKTVANYKPSVEFKDVDELDEAFADIMGNVKGFVRKLASSIVNIKNIGRRLDGVLDKVEGMMNSKKSLKEDVTVTSVTNLSDYKHEKNPQEIQKIKSQIGEPAKRFDSFFIGSNEEGQQEIWGMEGENAWLGKKAFKIIPAPRKSRFFEESEYVDSEMTKMEETLKSQNPKIAKKIDTLINYHHQKGYQQGFEEGKNRK